MSSANPLNPDLPWCLGELASAEMLIGDFSAASMRVRQRDFAVAFVRLDLQIRAAPTNGDI
jgi:hypothetical protein